MRPPEPPLLVVPVAAEPDRAEPSKNEPMRRAAAATPIPIAREAGFIATLMSLLPVLRPPAIQTRAGSRRFRLYASSRDHVQHDDEDDREEGHCGEDAAAQLPERGDLLDSRCQLTRDTLVEGEVPPDEERKSCKHGDVQRGLLAHA